MTDFTWTDEAIDITKTLFAAGRSATEIGAELRATFGGTLTRSAICGKLNRLGISRAKQPRTGPRLGRPAAPPRKPRVARTASPQPPLVLAPLVPDAAPEPPSRFRCDLLGLTNDTCRWPIGEPVSGFCGALNADLRNGVPYCGFHLRIAYDRRGDRGRSTTVQPGERRWGAAG